MKISKFLGLLMGMFLVIVLATSCGEDGLCFASTCNTGTADPETCDCICPSGFSGANCQIEDVCASQSLECLNGGSCVNGSCDCPDGYTGTNCESFDPANVQALLNNDMGPFELYNAGITLEQLYGNFYAGGLIFYLNTSNGSGMVAATSDQSTDVEFGCRQYDIPGASGSALGTGAQNTIDILADDCQMDGMAARLCADLVLNERGDWFLPSLDELNLIYINLHQNGHGGFAADDYYSSTEWDCCTVPAIDFNDGSLGGHAKHNRNFVRAARSF